MGELKIADFKTTKLPENEVIKRILAGEKELYEILMRRNNQKLFRVLRGYLADPSEIEDIMQDTYLQAYEKLWQYKQNAQFSTWLIRIGINKALVRIKQKAKIQATDVISITDNPTIEFRDEKQPGPADKMMGKEAKEMLEKAIENLDEKYRSVYIMREVEEMSMAEISDCLDLSVSNVKVRLHRAKGMIKENLYELSYSNELFEFGFSKCDCLVEHVLGKI
ncbi:MAG: RNA polymerase sigma factor [Cyclobacteriaceae bacterium]